MNKLFGGRGFPHHFPSIFFVPFSPLFLQRLSSPDGRLLFALSVEELQCESKKVAPLKLFAIFSLVMNLCNWKLLWLLRKHISMITPILVYLSEYLYKLYHFY